MNKEVVVFGRENPPCSGCITVKNKLDKANINYIYKDVSEDGAYKEMCELRLRSIPAVFVDKVFMKGESNIDTVIEEVLS